MPDYKKMYAILVSAVSAALDEIRPTPENIRIFKILRDALDKTEEIYIDSFEYVEKRKLPLRHGRGDH